MRWRNGIGGGVSRAEPFSDGCLASCCPACDVFTVSLSCQHVVWTVTLGEPVSSAITFPLPHTYTATNPVAHASGCGDSTAAATCR